MFSYDVQQVSECLGCAERPNSALKNFLKNEVQKGSPVAKFVKALREVLASGDSERLHDFVVKYHEKYKEVFFVLCRYLHAVPIGAVAEDIVTEYADEFNQTYRSVGDEIEVSDQATFDKIVASVEERITTGLQEQGLPNSHLIKNLTIEWIFDAPVAVKVYERLGAQ